VVLFASGLRQVAGGGEPGGGFKPASVGDFEPLLCRMERAIIEPASGGEEEVG